MSRRWHPETFVCAFRGHVAPAVRARCLHEGDWLIAVEAVDGGHLARCLRCDGWVLADPARADRETVGDLADLPVPERGKKLRDSLVLKAIAVDRGIHSLVFAILAVGLLFLRAHLGGLQDQARALVRNTGNGLAGTGQDTSRTFLLKELDRLLGLNPKTLGILLLTSVAYCAVEGVEAVGLWRGRRWAEYLTAVATAGFLPFEVDELLKKVTAGRVVALVINLAVLVYLVWAKRLFGLRGGAEADEDEIDATERLPVLPGQPVRPAPGGGEP
jgi:uncharacterized membrane protein (DUF2068 family)